DTVDWMSSYDDRIDEPEVLPAGFPNLLVNGSSGIAVGMSTSIPPHNLGEVVDATVAYIDDPDSSVADLMEHVEAPDFPTGGRIVGRNAVKKAYETGRAKLTTRGVVEREGEDHLVITEIPYQVDKSRWIERVADAVNDGTIEGIADIRDESDRDGIRVVIKLRRDAVADVVENQLFEHTRLEKTFSVINLALVEGEPRVLSLRELIDHYVDHRREVVTRRTEHDLGVAEDRAHVLEGRLVAVENAEDVVELIQDSVDRDAAREALEEEYGFTEAQSDHVVRMQLGSLTSLEVEDIESEYDALQDEIDRLQTILDSEEELMDVIKSELLEIKDEYADERRTEVVEADGEVTDEDLIPQRDVVVVLTRDGYAKRMDLDVFSTQRRGGKGVIGVDLKEGDVVSKVFVASSHDYVLCFTNQGRVHRLKSYEIPEMGRTARGRSVVNLLDLDADEEVTAVVDTSEFSEDECIAMVTRRGMVNRTCAAEFDNILSTGINAIRLEEGDELVDVAVTDGDSELVIGTRTGYAIRFDETEARMTGRYTKGVNGVKLRDGDSVAGFDHVCADDDRAVFTVTENGYGKRTALDEYSRQSRYGYGNIDIKTVERNGEAVSINTVSDDEEVLIVSDDGMAMRTSVDEVSLQGRNTMGVRVMELDDGDHVASVAAFEDIGETEE
ncbi:MAG: DNA gyrase subunit A, partial [Halobacteriales archaeon]